MARFFKCFLVNSGYSSVYGSQFDHFRHSAYLINTVKECSLYLFYNVWSQIRDYITTKFNLISNSNYHDVLLVDLYFWRAIKISDGLPKNVVSNLLLQVYLRIFRVLLNFATAMFLKKVVEVIKIHRWGFQNVILILLTHKSD